MSVTQDYKSATPAPARIQFTHAELACIASLLAAHIRVLERNFGASPVNSPLEGELWAKIEIADCALARVRAA